MVREKFDVEIPEGTHLGFSRDTGGAYRAHLFDNVTNELVGHAELFQPSEEPGSGAGSADPTFVFMEDPRRESHDYDISTRDVLSALALLGVLVAANQAAPHLKRWWSTRAVPFLRTGRSKLSRRPQPEAGTSSEVVFAALNAYRASMNSQEARERFVAALVARMFSEEQFRLLQNARIEDESGSLELASAVETLTPQQLAEGFRSILEANPSWPDQETLAELGKFLNGSMRGKDSLLEGILGSEA